MHGPMYIKNCLVFIVYRVTVHNKFTTNAQNILHLNQLRYGHIWSWTVAPFQRSRGSCEWFDKQILCLLSVSYCLLSHNPKHVSTITPIWISAHMTTSDHGLSHPFKGRGAGASVLTDIKLCLLSVSYCLLSHNPKHMSTITSVWINAHMTTSDNGLSYPFKGPGAVASVLTDIKLCLLRVYCCLLSHNSI